MKRKNLRTKIISRLAIMSTCAMSILLFSMYQYISHTLQNDLIDRGNFIAHTMGEQSVNQILARKYLALALMLTDTKALDQDLAYLFITDPQGNVLAHSFGQAFPVDLQKINRVGKKSLQRISINGQEILDINSSILSGTLGNIHVGMSEARINGELKRIFSLAAVVIFISFVTAAWLLWFFLEQLIIRPIKMLERTFQNVQNEGFETPVIVAADDEIGQLGNSFNQLAKHLIEVDLQRTNVIDELNISNQNLSQMISEREEAEIRLAESEQKLRLILDSAGEGIFGMDASGSCTFCNKSSLRMLGYDRPDDLIGKNVNRHIYQPSADAPDSTRREHHIYRAFLHGECIHTDNEVFWKTDQTPLPVEYWAYPQIKDDRIVGTVVTFVDTSKRKEAEEENRNLELMLLQSQKMDAIGTLAGGIAHDFNNILTSIYGNTELAKMHCGENTKLAKNLDQIMIASDRARDLVKQILTFGRRDDICKQPLELNQLIFEALKLIRSSIPATISINHQLDSNVVAIADANQIHQVLMNLCTNAYHAMAEKGGALSVRLEKVEYTEETLVLDSRIPPGRYAVIEVSDTGCGMDSDTLQKIFDPYYTTKPTGKGTGLGLAVVHGIVKEHSGKIVVHSEPGVGSMFRVFLPLAEGDAPAEMAEPCQHVNPGNGERIIFVDDEQQIRDIAREILTSNNYMVELYDNAKHALERLQKDPYTCDMLITDMAMPGMNGKELVQEVLALRPTLPIILCTGYSELIDSESAKRAGIMEYMQKPVTMNLLCERIQKLLEKAENMPPREKRFSEQWVS